MDEWVDGHMTDKDGWMIVGWMDEWMEKRMNEWMDDRWMDNRQRYINDRWMDGWTMING